MELNKVIQELSSAEISDEALAKNFLELSRNIHLMEGRAESELKIFLNPEWLRRGDEVVKSFRAFILNFVSAFPTLIKPVIKMIIQSFQPPSTKSISSGKEQSGIKPKLIALLTPDQMAAKGYHKILESIVQLIPSSSTLLIQMLASSYPYIKLPRLTQVSYLSNLLAVSKYLPNYRKLVLEIAISKMIQFDTYCPKDIIESYEEHEEPVFDMEIDNENPDGSTTAEPEMIHPQAKVLDQKLEIMYNYIDSICRPTDTGELDWEATKKLYKDFLTIFDGIILPTHACNHVQFVMFYICSFRAALCEGFIDYLWKKLQNHNVSPVIRQAAICYIGSMLCRASYIRIGMVKDSLQLMNNWLHSYLDNQSDAKSINYGCHGTFYAVCQTLFYIIAFRHKELAEMETGLLFLRGLNINRLVTCSLNPLKVCLPAIVANFAAVTKNYQIAYCYTIIERNTRLSIPVASEAASLLTGMSSFAALDAYFPFDPYILKRSGKKITTLYRIYSGQIETADPKDEVDEDEDDFIQEGVISTPTAVMGESFSYGTSPGFKETLSPKSR